MAYIYEVQYKGEDNRYPRDDWEVLAALQRSFEDGLPAPANAAVVLGLVKPTQCIECGGLGRVKVR